MRKPHLRNKHRCNAKIKTSTKLEHVLNLAQHCFGRDAVEMKEKDEDGVNW
jgi:hypothetical protein